jgi:flagellin
MDVVAVTLGNTIASLVTQRHLGRTSEGLSRTFERLSSGLRINRASDDAAGLSVASTLQADTRVFTQAIRNVSDALSATSIAEGALEELSTISMRQLELATQAANGSYSTSQRLSMQREANALVSEFNRIIQTTTFNDIDLFSTTTGALSIQAGRDSGGEISMSLQGELSRTVGDGTFLTHSLTTVTSNTTGVASADINSDGNLDLISVYTSGVLTQLGNGDGTFRVGTSYTASTGHALWRVRSEDLNRDGHADIIVGDLESNFGVLINNGNGTFQATRVYDNGGTYTASANGLAIADMTGDGVLDIVTANRGSNKVSIWRGNGDGTYATATTFNNVSLGLVQDVAVGDFNGDGRTDLVVSHATGGTHEILLQQASGGFSLSATFTTPINSLYTSIRVADLNLDGIDDIATIGLNNQAGEIHLGNGNGTFLARQAVALSGGETPMGLALSDVNGDGYRDLIIRSYNTKTFVAVNNGDGRFGSATAYDVGQNYKSGTGPAYDIDTGDFDNNGTIDIISSNMNDGNVSLLRGRERSVTSIAFMDLRTQSSARSALTTIRQTLDRIAEQRGSIGATESRFSTAINHLYAVRENYQAAASRILDADIGNETAQLVRHKILQQAGSAILAQANLLPSLAVKLLQ